MQKINTIILPALMIFSLAALTGCTTTCLDMKSWHGRSINDLYFEWGTADEASPANKPYGRVHSWFFERKIDGKVKT